MGWQGKIDFTLDSEYDWNDRARNGFKESVADWFAMQSPLEPPSARRPINCTWHHYRNAAKSGVIRVPDGWEQNISESGLKTYIFHTDNKWLSMWHFRYPVPLPTSAETIEPHDQLRSLFAKTTSCHFTTRPVHSYTLPGENSPAFYSFIRSRK